MQKRKGNNNSINYNYTTLFFASIIFVLILTNFIYQEFGFNTSVIFFSIIFLNFYMIFRKILPQKLNQILNKISHKTKIETVYNNGKSDNSLDSINNVNPTKFCESCGEKLISNLNYCESCGKLIS